MLNIARLPPNDRRDLFRAAAQRMRVNETNFYHCAWASYDTAVPGTIKLLPPDHNRAALAADYRAMEAMLFGAIPNFDDILASLSELEFTLNALPRPRIVDQPSATT